MTTRNAFADPIEAPDGNTKILAKDGIDDAGFLTVEDVQAVPLRSYTVATLPSAAVAAQLIYVSDGTGNKRFAVSDGTNWRFPDGAIVS